MVLQTNILLIQQLYLGSNCSSVWNWEIIAWNKMIILYIQVAKMEEIILYREHNCIEIKLTSLHSIPIIVCRYLQSSLHSINQNDFIRWRLLFDWYLKWFRAKVFLYKRNKIKFGISLVNKNEKEKCILQM